MSDSDVVQNGHPDEKNAEVEIELDDETYKFEVKPMKKWPNSAIHELRTGDVYGWAEGALTEESFELWKDVNMNLDEIEQFFEVWGKVTGSTTKTSRKRSHG